jgi:hypothetical protein
MFRGSLSSIPKRRGDQHRRHEPLHPCLSDNVNPDVHVPFQFGCGCDQCTMNVDADGLAIAGLTFIAGQHRDYDL